MLVISKEQSEIISKGGVALAVDMSTLSKVRVALVDGKPCKVITTQRAYTGVKLYDSNNTDLNLTQEETKELLDKHEIVVYRSSGAVDEKGETLTRAEQIKRGVARKIKVVYNKEANKAIIAEDASASYGEQVKLTIVE